MLETKCRKHRPSHHWFYHSKGNDQGTSTITKGNDSSTWRGSKGTNEADLIKAEVNVKEIVLLDDASGFLVKQIKPF
jgi:hypothetical protein